MAGREKFNTEYTAQSMDAIDRFSLERGMNRIDAIQHLIALGDFVSSTLVEGKEFLIKDGKELNHVDWKLPPSRGEAGL